MTNITTGDMARAYLLRRHTADIKSQMQTLTAELSTGRKADVGRAVSGDYRILAGIEHGLSTLEAFHTTATEADLFAGGVQTALETVQSASSDVSANLLAAGTGGNSAQVHTTASNTRQAFFAAVSAINLQIGDRYLLSGAATDRKPVSGAQEILDSLTVVIAGQTTVDGVSSAIANWFDAPVGAGGFLDSAYGGSQSGLSPIKIGQDSNFSIGLTAAAPELREVLKGLAIGALVAEGALAGNNVAQADLLKVAGDTLIAADSNLTAVRADVGISEAQITDTLTRNASEASALAIARNGIVAADPYETASNIEAVSTQLETLYSLTARLSRLTLANFLK